MSQQLRSDAQTFLKTSKVACLAPWVHAHLSSLGDFTPCCEIPALAKVDGATLASHWNSEAMAKVRLAMLADEALDICGKCYEKESAGATSYRKVFNDRYSDLAGRLDQTRPDGTLSDEIQPVDLDLRFSNLCNFRCRSCWHGSSSRWYSDALALGWTAGSSPIIDAGADRSSTLAGVLALLPQLRSLYFAGGEPLLMEEHYTILEEALRLGRSDIELDYNTNLSELSLGNRSVLDLWQRFPRVVVAASADGMGAVGELMRKGMDWKRFEENVLAVRAQCPHVKLLLAVTVSVLNIFHLADFYRHAHEALGFDHRFIRVKPLQVGLHYNIQMLPTELKQRAANVLRKFIATLPEDGPGDIIQEIDRMTGRTGMEQIVAFLWAQNLKGHIPEFQRVTQALDELRGEDTFATIPQLLPLKRVEQSILARARRSAAACRDGLRKLLGLDKVYGAN